MTSFRDSELDERALVARALVGDSGATRELVVSLLPVVQVRIARFVARRGTRGGRDKRQDIEDLAQEVFVALFERDGRILRAWDPARGLSLAGFCALVAEREVASILRSGKRSRWLEDATPSDELERDAGEVLDVESSFASREHLARLVDCIREELSPLGLEMFQRLMIDGEEVRSVCDATGMSAESVYAWRSRLMKLARAIAHRIASDESSTSGTGSIGLDGRSERSSRREDG